MFEFNAAVMSAANAPLAIERVRLTTFGPRDVLVSVRAAGVCHTDWEAQQGKFGPPAPIILGHEGAGVVSEVGAEVRTLRPGDHVVFSPFPNCGTCFYCRRDQPMLCEPVGEGHRNGRLPYGPARLARGGEAISHFLGISSFAEFAVVPENGAIAIPKDMPLDLACTLGCAVITGIGAVQRIAQVRFDENVCVVGCGPIGLNVVQGARLAGARTIVASDTNPERLALAVRFGATHTVGTDRESVVESVRFLTDGRGADHSFETAGNEGALQTALDATRAGGTTTILGKMEPQSFVSLRFGSLMGERRIRRSALGGGRVEDDVPALARAYLDGRLLLEELVTARVQLAGINRALERAGEGAEIRSIIVMNA